jgi:hypothetical protein
MLACVSSFACWDFCSISVFGLKMPLELLFQWISGPKTRYDIFVRAGGIGLGNNRWRTRQR